MEDQAQAECFKYDPMIKKFYYSHRELFKHSVLSLEVEDVLQEMRVCILKAIPKYDKNKGASLSTYLYMHLSDRLKDLMAKLVRRGKTNAGLLQDLPGSDKDISHDEYKNDFYEYNSRKTDVTYQEGLADFIDIKMIIEDMRPKDKELFVDRHFHGYFFKELSEKHNITTTHLNTKMRRFDKIIKTLHFQ